MESNNGSNLSEAVAKYRSDLLNLLAQEAVKMGFLKDSLRSIPELSSLVRSFFEQCIREYHSLYDHANPLAVLGSCCFAGAAAAHVWNAVGEDILQGNLFALLSRERGMKYLDDTALEFAGFPGGTYEGDRLSACIKGNWSIMALASMSSAVRGREAEEAMLFLQATAEAMFLLGEAIALARG